MISRLFRIVWHSLRTHRLSSSVTVGSVALAIGLAMSVFSLSTQTRNAFLGGPIGFDAVLGARGSQLQLVLNTVFHLETSPGNIPWSVYQQVKSTAGVRLAVPYALGDNYYGYRIVGTSDELFTEFEYQKGQKFAIQPGGRHFDQTRREAVIGSYVAQQTGLRVGSKFNPSHGLAWEPGTEHAEVYVVVGVMEPTNSPSDRVIWIPIEGVFRMSGHVLRGSDPTGFLAQPGTAIPDEHKEVSAVMLEFEHARVGPVLADLVNRQGKVATLAWPIPGVLAQFFDKLGWVVSILELVAYLVVVVAAGSILASLHNTMNERRQEFAILRALGASRVTVSSVIVLESTVIAALGSVVGFGVYLGVLAVARMLVRDTTGVVLDLFDTHWALWAVPSGMIVLGALSGVLPAMKAYSTDVATHLQPNH